MQSEFSHKLEGKGLAWGGGNGAAAHEKARTAGFAGRATTAL